MMKEDTIAAIATPPGRGGIVAGTYQSPILIQWHRAPGGTRTVDVTLREFA